MIDLLAGVVQIKMDTYATAAQHVAQGKLRALAFASRRRSALMREVPTVAEMGLPGYEGILWIGIMAPAATPKPIIDKLASAAGRTVRAPALAARLERDGVEPVGGTPEAFGARIAAEIGQWRELGRSVNIKLEIPSHQARPPMQILTQGPDPRPKSPRLACPPGACDTHIHLFGPAEKYPFAPDSPYTSRDALPETFMALQHKLGLSKAVIVSPGGYGRDYRLLADTLARVPDRFRGIALMPDGTSAAELARLTKLGVRGLRMMSAKRGRHVPNYSPEIAARAAEHGWHVQFYPHDTDIVDYADKLMALPNTIVLDHFASIPAAGGVDQPAVKAVLKMLDSGRVWLKLSGPMRCTTQTLPYPDVTPLARAFVRHAPERMVWGSDWPHVNLDGREMPNDGDLLDLLLEWVPDAATRNRILVDNACALYGFPLPARS